MTALRVVAAALLVAVLAGPATASAAPRQSIPAPVLPTLPPQVEPATAAVSPVVWEACRAVGLVIGLTAVAGTLAGVPGSVSTPVSDAVATATGPALTIFFELCQQIPLPDDPPSCAVDDQTPALPTLGHPVLLAGLLANELRALDVLFAQLGVPLKGALGAAADDLLQCAAGKDPTPATPPAEHVPFVSPGLVPPQPDVALPSIAGGRLSVPSPAELAASPLAPRVGSAGAALPGARPVSSSGSEPGRGVALGLVALAALAAVAWLRAGAAR